MATTTPDNIWTPDSQDDYALTADLAATAVSVQNALTRRANSYTGTTAQRTAFTAAAPEGALWSDTNGEKILWIKQGASWQRVWPVGDTGWVDVPPLPGYAALGGAPLQIRRIGDVVYPRWGFSSQGMTANSSFHVADIPVGFRPPIRDPYFTVASSVVAATGRATINPVSGQVWLDTSTTLGVWYIFSTPWLID